MNWWKIIDNEKIKLQIAKRVIGRRNKRIKELEKIFRHYHVNAQNETDTCKECGLDLRDPIHIRENK